MTVRVWHVGRRGEVAGGMTQVVNGYLDWPFAHCELGVIVSRDGSHGPRAMMIMAAAVRRVLLLPRRDTVVVVHLSQGGSFVREGLLLQLARRRGLATVAHLHGSSFVEFAASKPTLVRRVLGAADRVFVLSDATADAVAALVGAERVRQVPNAVPAGTPRTKSRRVVFGGAVSRRKGVDVLLAAWQALAPSGWQLDVVGPVTDPEVLPTDGPRPDVVLHGGLPHERLMELLAEAEVAVLPSRDEAQPMFILEALARDACVVSTTVGGIPAVLADGAGLIVPPGDVDALTDALRTVTTDDDRRAMITAAGRRRFDDHYSAAAVYPAVEQEWLATLER